MTQKIFLGRQSPENPEFLSNSDDTLSVSLTRNPARD
jgi:hypothetical protein